MWPGSYRYLASGGQDSEYLEVQTIVKGKFFLFYKNYKIFASTVLICTGRVVFKLKNQSGMFVPDLTSLLIPVPGPDHVSSRLRIPYLDPTKSGGQNKQIFFMEEGKVIFHTKLNFSSFSLFLKKKCNKYIP
jgi:hypothetical protein